MEETLTLASTHINAKLLLNVIGHSRSIPDFIAAVFGIFLEELINIFALIIRKFLWTTGLLLGNQGLESMLIYCLYPAGNSCLGKTG